MNNEKVKFLLNWNHFGEHLSACMTKLMTDSSYSDIIIATGDKHMIYSHRFVLANSSKYFQRLFKQVIRQRGIQLVVALPEVKYEIFKILMNYMYKGETQVPHELLPSVIKAGQFLEINGLVNLNENEGGGSGESLTQFYTKDSLAKTMNTEIKQYKRIPSTLRDNIHSRENTHSSCITVIQTEKAKRPSVCEDLPSKSTTAEENGKENRSKISKSTKCKNLPREKKEIIQLPLKRRTYVRESVKKLSPLPSSSSSIPIESSPPRKILKRNSQGQEIINVKIKEEKENDKSPIESDDNEIQELPEKITIKMEVPDDIDEVYTELQCEFCEDVYLNPSDWVRHMSEQHSDRGFQSYKDLDKTVRYDSVGGNAVITCVVCSSVCFSAAEWAKHLRLWHSERDLTLTSTTESRKNRSKNKKEPGIRKPVNNGGKHM